jgi:osmotically-inducible protein OsmY
MVLAGVLVGEVAGCASVGTCGFGGCPDDSKLNAAVWATLKSHPAAQPPNLVHVQTLNHVVFLRGQVDTDTERLSLEEAARGVAGVKCVQDLINLSYQGH